MKSANFVLVARFCIDVLGVIFAYCISLLSWGSSLLEFLMFLLIFSVCSFDTELVVLTFSCLNNYTTGRLKAGGCNFFPCLLELFMHKKTVLSCLL